MEFIIKSIAGGILIGIGGLGYLSCDNAYAGAVLFSFGLLSIVRYNQILYTGFLTRFTLSREYFKTIPKITEAFLGNGIGTFLVACLAATSPKSQIYIDKAIKIIATKSSVPTVDIIASAIFCGMIMALILCTLTYKVESIFLGIPLFIICGFNHSIADMFYVFLSCADINKMIYIVIVALGNFIGGNIVAAIYLYTNKIKE